MSVDSLIGRKVGMTSVFDASGAMLGVTVLEVGPEPGHGAPHDGQGRLRVRRPRLRGEAGLAGEEAAGRLRQEGGTRDRASSCARCASRRRGLKAGDTCRVADVFEVGGKVDVVGTSRGRGFQGVRRRHKFNLGPRSHGSKNYRETKSTARTRFPRAAGRASAWPATWATSAALCAT
jgi:large subunit ribosomal protein L3